MIEVLATGAAWNRGVGCDNAPEPDVATGAAVGCARGAGEGIDSREVEGFPEPELVCDEGTGPNGCAIEELVKPEVVGAEVIV
jgi:hypothetical protein